MYFVVLNNIFPPYRDIYETHDLDFVTVRVKDALKPRRARNELFQIPRSLFLLILIIP
jgi:hypothetical protein